MLKWIVHYVNSHCYRYVFGWLWSFVNRNNNNTSKITFSADQKDSLWLEWPKGSGQPLQNNNLTMGLRQHRKIWHLCCRWLNATYPDLFWLYYYEARENNSVLPHNLLFGQILRPNREDHIPVTPTCVLSRPLTIPWARPFPKDEVYFHHLCNVALFYLPLTLQRFGDPGRRPLRDSVQSLSSPSSSSKQQSAFVYHVGGHHVTTNLRI